MITKVTITGADDSIVPEQLIELSKQFPFVEWGILVSRKNFGAYRFPSKDWIKDLMLRGRANMINTSCHLCGAVVREILVGNDKFIKDELGDLFINLFQRVQINTHGIKHELEFGLVHVLNNYPHKEFIIQYDNANMEILGMLHTHGVVNYSTLFDLSHGAGVLPSEWPKPISNIKCGYAGGLSPENVESQIQKILEVCGENKEIWIDTETKVRSGDDSIFDLNKVRNFLETASKYVKYVK